ncbi:hypothetical protein [Pedomonas sp. V897]
MNNVFDSTAVNNRSSGSNTGGKTSVYSTPPLTFDISLMKKLN